MNTLLVCIYPADIVFGTVDRIVAVDGGSGLPVAHEGPGLALWGFTHQQQIRHHSCTLRFQPRTPDIVCTILLAISVLNMICEDFPCGRTYSKHCRCILIRGGIFEGLRKLVISERPLTDIFRMPSRNPGT